jgi:DNA repair exonuclease SbcCD nuclease subunit
MEFKRVASGIGYPYGIISDVHCHNWSAYSFPTSRGLNSRLQQTLDAIEEAGEAVLKAGGKDLVITGDLFHTRGVVRPSVFNPTLELFRNLIAKGLRVWAIDGNHDMEGKVAASLQSAMYGLDALEGFTVFYEPTIVDEQFLFIPYDDNPELTHNLTTKGSTLIPNLTIFCHVGLSGVLPGNMGHVLNAEDLLELDIKYAFCGHFHNHVSFDSRVYSVGALTHQTWSDAGSLAGYLIVHEDRVEQFETKAPQFQDYLTGFDVRNNYIRLKGIELTEEEAEAFVKELKAEGALAVLDQSTRPTIAVKDHLKVVKVDLGINTALETFCKHTYGDKWKEVFDACLRLKS